MRALLTAALIATASPALALPAPACGKLDEVQRVMEKQFNETMVGVGATDSTAVVLFMSPGGETWTIATVTPKGTICIQHSGINWVSRPIGAPV